MRIESGKRGWLEREAIQKVSQLESVLKDELMIGEIEYVCII